MAFDEKSAVEQEVKAKGGGIALRRPQNQQHGRAGQRRAERAEREMDGVRDVRIREERQR